MHAARTRALVAAVCLVAGLVWVAPSAAPVKAATIRNVPGTYATLQAAIDASAAGDTIQIAAGTYVGHATVDKSLSIEGAGADVTTLDGNFDGSPIISADLADGEFLLVRGLQFYRGNAWIDDIGGALRLTGAGSATISENTFYANHADLGGAIYSTLSGTVSIEFNTFTSNGGVTGGAIWLSNPVDTTVLNNMILFNTASSGIGESLFWQSTDDANGPSIRSNTIVGGFDEEGVEINGSGQIAGAVLRNNIITGHTTGALVRCSTAGNVPTFETNDLWNPDGSLYTEDCNAGDAPTDLNVDPLFTVPDWDDYHIRPDSPLIDAGTADAGLGTDIDGDSRPFDGDETGGAQIDIGADESVDPLAIVPGSAWFGDVEVGLHSDSTFTLKNLGAGSLSITSATLGGDGADQYDILDDACTGATLQVDDTCEVAVRFAPQSSTAVTDALLTIVGPGDVGTRDVRLSGFARQVAVLSTTGFDDVPIGTTANRTFTVDNLSASQALTVSSITLSGPNVSELSITSQTCTTAPVSPGQSCDIHVSFTPAGLGNRDAEITVTGPLPVGTLKTGIGGTGVATTTPVTWASPTKPGGSYAWNFSNALARTVRDGSQRLHQGYATDRISGSWARDSGPYAGIYYTRSTSGSTWTTPKRITSTKKHVIRFGLAAAGSRVYVAYVTQTKIVNFSPSAPRVLYVRVNTNHGNPSYWKSSVRLTGTTGRVDYPTVAASGTDVHVAFTNSNNGDIIVATSKDRGVTWVKRKVGTTTNSTSSGREGLPSVAVSGSTVAVTWITNGTGILATRVSSNRGTSWDPTETHDAAASNGEFQTAVAGTRVGVVWTATNSVFTRLRVNGGWEDAREQGANGFVYSPAIALQGTSRVAVSYAEETSTPNYVALKYAESTNNGVAWYKPQTIASTSSSSRRANDWPTILWPSSGTRYVSWNGWTSGTNNYRLYMRKGTGAPAGLSFVAAVASNPVQRQQSTDGGRFGKDDGGRTR